MKNKLFSSALLFDDMKKIIYSAAISIVVITLFFSNFLTQYHNYTLFIYSHSGHFGTMGYNWYLAVFMILMGVITLAVFYNNKEVKYGYMMTQPISKDSFVVTKTIGIILACAIPFIFYIIISSILITLNSSVSYGMRLQAYKYVFSLAFIVFSLTIFIVLFLQLIQMFFNNTIAAIAIFVFTIACILCEIISIFSSASPKIEFVRTFIKFLCYKLFGTYSELGIIPMFMDFCNVHQIISGIILLIMAAILLKITIILNRKIKYENLSNIFTFKIAKKIFKIVVSVFIAFSLEAILAVILVLLIEVITGLNFDTYVSRIFANHTFKEFCEYAAVAINISWIPLTILPYRFIGKIEKRRMMN